MIKDLPPCSLKTETCQFLYCNRMIMMFTSVDNRFTCVAPNGMCCCSRTRPPSSLRRTHSQAKVNTIAKLEPASHSDFARSTYFNRDDFH